VFEAGTVQWAWGLNEHHDTETGAAPEQVNANATRVSPDPDRPGRDIQQATANRSAEMVETLTLQPVLVTVSLGPLRMEGIASDEEGGCVAAADMSSDDGLTWHAASGRDN